MNSKATFKVGLEDLFEAMNPSTGRNNHEGDTSMNRLLLTLLMKKEEKEEKKDEKKEKGPDWKLVRQVSALMLALMPVTAPLYILICFGGWMLVHHVVFN